MLIDARGVIAGTLALAALLAGGGRDAGAAQDTNLLHDNLRAQFSTWLGKEANLAPFRASVAPAIDPRKGVLEFPAPTTPVWVFRLPDTSLGAARVTSQAALTNVLKKYLTEDGKQALESVPEDRREATLKELTANAAARIDEKPGVAGATENHGGAVTPPLTASPAPGEAPPLASGQSFGPSVTYPSGQLMSSQAVTAAAWQDPADIGLNPYELFWSGQAYRALPLFRAQAASQHDDVLALYFQALCELATGDTYTAQATLQRAAAAEASANASRQVSLGLVRVQGPVRNWIEAARRAPAVRAVPVLTTR